MRSRDFNRFRLLYSLYNKYYAKQFGWQDMSSMQQEEDLKHIPANSYAAELAYLQRKKFIEINNNKVLISGKGIDVIDHIMDQYLEYLRISTDQESKYEYRHLSAMEDIGDDDAVRSQLYYYIKQRKLLFKNFLLSSNIFRKTTFLNLSNDYLKLENDNDNRNEMEYNGNPTKTRRYDAFISHASEDKDSIARPLYDYLKNKGLTIWYDDFTLTVGDSLRKSIDHGLRNSVCGIVILSRNFFIKEWTQRELDGLFALADNTPNKIILPIWHEITKTEVSRYSPMLAGLLALSSDKGIDEIGAKLEQEIQRLKVA
jgi:hypothetical protein